MEAVEEEQIDVMGTIYLEGLRAGVRILKSAGMTGDEAAASVIDAVLDAQGPGSGFLAEAAHAWIHEQGQAIAGEGMTKPHAVA